MGRSPLSIDVGPKDQKELVNLLSSGVQQVRVVLRALALLQLAKGASAPRISEVVPLTPQAIRTIGHRYQRGGLEGRLRGRWRRIYLVKGLPASPLLQTHGLRLD